MYVYQVQNGYTSSICAIHYRAAAVPRHCLHTTLTSFMTHSVESALESALSGSLEQRIQTAIHPHGVPSQEPTAMPAAMPPVYPAAAYYMPYVDHHSPAVPTGWPPYPSVAPMAPPTMHPTPLPAARCRWIRTNNSSSNGMASARNTSTTRTSILSHEQPLDQHQAQR